MTQGRHGDPLQHINDDHAGELLTVARAFGAHRDASRARAEGVDCDGIDLVLDTPSGRAQLRVAFTEPIPQADYPGGIRVAFVRLARRARSTVAADDGYPSRGQPSTA